MKQNEEKKTANLPVSPELIARAKEGEQAAYTELYETTSPALYRSVRSMVHDEDLAWDIVQESYIRAFRSLDKLGANEAFLPWLRRIAVNETARAMAERRPLRFSELEDEDGELPELPDLRADSQPELILDRQETSRLVREILADLPEQQNVIVGMRYYEDLSVREISELLKLAPGTVKAQLHRGRKHVEDRVRALEKQGVKLYGLSP
ncbi:MAG: sigma-70 family RNA polymerase sigma factor, partial [Oscillospiraceae bacterium]|nr:sigma-70 family RNA polymerase sigma factor [Oscillospiraceae bacterium]